MGPTVTAQQMASPALGLLLTQHCATAETLQDEGKCAITEANLYSLSPMNDVHFSQTVISTAYAHLLLEFFPPEISV